ncbi:MAG: VanW family protein [Candidatus Gottesmanbacteria bacterium]|nr:VanW family protein [Candidatus Gottesmanbacteria bacterium]
MNTLLALAIYAITTTKAVAGDYLLGTESVRSERAFSLADRYPDAWVNDIFRYNILHTLSLMDTTGKDPTKPQSYSFTLKPGEVFAFHEDVLPQFKGRVTQTMHAHFNYTDGFKSDGYLYGDGVCHLAALLYWAAKDAGLAALAPTNHDFANIPEVPKEYGVSIYFTPGAHDSNAQHNLYITNTFDRAVQFAFAYDNTNLTVKVLD